MTTNTEMLRATNNEDLIEDRYIAKDYLARDVAGTETIRYLRNTVNLMKLTDTPSEAEHKAYIGAFDFILNCYNETIEALSKIERRG